jgi:hypothetical protein
MANHTASVSEILNTASRLDARELDHLLSKLNLLRAQLNTTTISKKESDLLMKINVGFPIESWNRLAYLDAKMEDSDISPEEADESLKLAESLEEYTIKRFELLKKLAQLRASTIEDVMSQLGIAPQ